jgi:hypothetical protein
MFVRFEAARKGDSAIKSSTAWNLGAAFMLVVLCLSILAVRSADAAEPEATVSGHVTFPESAGNLTINSVSGTLSGGSGTVSESTFFTFCEHGHCAPRSDFEGEGEVTCVDASVVEGGMEATIGGTFTKAKSHGSSIIGTVPFFRITVIDSSTGAPDEESGLLPSNTPGCTPENWPLVPVPAGGGETPNGYTVTGAVDPQTRIVEFQTQNLVTREARPRIPFVGGSNGLTFQCRFDTEAFRACSGPGTKDRPVTPLSDGTHTFEVAATDGAGHTDPTPAKATFEVDTTPPDTTLVEGPSGLIDTAEPSWTFASSENANFYCSLDGGEYKFCYPTFEPGHQPEFETPLTDGKHTLRVRTEDVAGNVDPTPVKISITVDTAAPDTSITSSPAGPTKDTTPKIKFASSEPGSTFQCRFDAEPFGPCTGPAGSVPPAPLSDGTHEFEVEAIDKAGNVDASPAPVSFVIDTTPPETTIVSGPGGEGAAAAFELLASDGTLECRLDSAEWASCGSTVRYEGLPAGTHTFRARARDEAGNVDATPAVAKFKVK